MLDLSQGRPSTSTPAPIDETHTHTLLTHRRVVVNKIELHLVEAATGPAVILLHGFPEFWYSWRRQLPVLARAGYRAIAPDLRGYNESAKPPGVARYRMRELVADIADLIEQLAEGPVVVVGHDWGGVLAWRLAMQRPDLLRGLVVLNAPHPATFSQALTHPRQLLRSWYAFFFQLPWLPEALLSFQNFGLMGYGLQSSAARPESFTPYDLRQYKAAFAKPGALTAMLNYYRAAFRYQRAESKEVRPIQLPTLVLWGDQDTALTPYVLEGLGAWVPGVQIVRLPHASHWVQHDEPEIVNQALLDFLTTQVNERTNRTLTS
jgi:pimeloyl-ACP methyl ester carboxylesterase